MQLVQATRDALLKPLSTVVGIVERRHTLPILANILLRKNGSDVSFLATDLEVQITTNADFGVGEDNAATTVAARKLLDILKALPDFGDVRLGLDSGKLTIGESDSRPSQPRPATLAPPSTARYPTGMSFDSSSTFARASPCEWPGAMFP